MHAPTITAPFARKPGFFTEDNEGNEGLEGGQGLRGVESTDRSFDPLNRSDVKHGDSLQKITKVTKGWRVVRVCEVLSLLIVRSTR